MENIFNKTRWEEAGGYGRGTSALEGLDFSSLVLSPCLGRVAPASSTLLPPALIKQTQRFLGAEWGPPKHSRAYGGWGE